jgi:phosphoribosylaminoimidazole carboxylase (NCAIR synthetase)
MNKINKIKKHRTLKISMILFSAFAVTSAAIIAPIVTLHQKNHTNDLKDDPASAVITTADVEQLQADALTKISKKIYFLDHKEGEDDYAHDDVIKQTGAFLFNVNQTVTNYQKDNKLTDDPSQLNNVRYSAIMQESKNAGIYLGDINSYQKNEDNSVKQYVKILQNQGVDPSQAQQDGILFRKIYENTLSQARTEL